MTETMKATIEWHISRTKDGIPKISRILKTLKRKYGLTLTQAEDALQEYANAAAEQRP